jgi:ubiquinone biosynthesis UbiH/UbiF/VisC/COQ6 family hydroxylase
MVGSCAAVALAANGMRVALVEPVVDSASANTATQEYDLRVSAISPGSRAILQQIGIWDQLDASRVCYYEQMHIWHQHGEASVSFDAVDLARDNLGAIVENRSIQNTLQRACDADPNIEWFMPDRIESLLRNQSDGIELRLESGRCLNAALLIAADGRNSPTRELAGIEVQSGSYRQTAIVANVDTALPHRRTAWQRFLSTGPLAFLPLANGQSSIVWSCDDEFASQVVALDDKAFCAALAQAFEFKLGEVTACSERRSFPLGWHHCERWLQGRVLLVGDAAHGVHPLAGQGVNLGFSDVELCARLNSAQPGPVSHKQLRLYERRRKSETWVASTGFSALKSIYGFDQAWITQPRDLGMRLLDNMPWLKRAMVGKAIHNSG